MAGQYALTFYQLTVKECQNEVDVALAHVPSNCPTVRLVAVAARFFWRLDKPHTAIFAASTSSFRSNILGRASSRQ